MGSVLIHNSLLGGNWLLAKTIALCRGIPKHRREGDNAEMPQVSIYVAVIAAGAAVLGAAIAPMSTAYHKVSAAKRDRVARQEAAVRQACMDLLRAARDLRVQVANTAAYHGNEMGARLERVRQLEADAASHADEVALLLPMSVADSAVRLSRAVSALATAAQANVKPGFGASLRDPDFTDLDACIEDFRVRVIAYSRNTAG